MAAAGRPMAAQQFGEAPSKGKSYDDAFNFSKPTRTPATRQLSLVLLYCIFSTISPSM